MDVVYLITTLGEQGLEVDPTANSTLNAVQVASLLLGVVLPILVGLVTKVSTNPALKSILLLALSCVSGFLTEFINSSNFVWQQALLTSLVTFVIGVASYYGLWVPTGVANTAQNSLVKDGGTRVRNQHGHVNNETVIPAVMVLGIALALIGAILSRVAFTIGV